MTTLRPRRWLAALALWGTPTLVVPLAVLGGCGHARTVEPATPPAEEKEAKEAKEAKETKDDEKRGGPRAKLGGATFTSHHSSSKEKSDDSDKDDGAMRLSTSPAGLLKPGAMLVIQEKLAGSGDLEGEPSGKMDAPTRKALEAFQRQHDLPATGIPDDATVGRLGLKAAEVFRSGAGSPE